MQWLAKVKRENRKLRKTLFTKQSFTEILRTLVNLEDSEVSGIYCTITGPEPFRKVIVDIHANQSHTPANITRMYLRDNRESTCQIETWNKARQYDTTTVMKEIRSMLRAYWKSQYRSGPTGLIDLKRNLKVVALAERTFQVFLKQGVSASLLYCDLDNFKRVNTQYGKKKGDGVLKEFGAILEFLVSDSAIPLHDGGDEFVIIYPNYGGPSARKLASEIRASIRSHDFGLVGIKVSVSIGIATFTHSKNFEELLEESYRAMERAKHYDPQHRTHHKLSSDKPNSQT